MANQIVDLTVVPFPLAPQMGINEALRLLIAITNQLPGFIGTSSGAATAANQALEIAALGNIPAKGSATSANSQPVVIASDQNVPVKSAPVTTITVSGDPAAVGITALAANSNRRRYTMQNLSTNTLYVKEGIGASTTSFSYICKGSTVQDDGSSPIFIIDDYQGALTVAGTSPRYVCTEAT